MNLHALRLFHETAEKGSVTRAAEAMHISQPAVTAQIRNLEQELGLRLLSPNGRGILLTEEGQKLAEQAKRLFSLESEIERAMERLKNGAAGKLTIAATYLPANFLLPKWIRVFKDRYPDVDVSIKTATSNEAIRQLIEFEADAALIGGFKEADACIHQTVVLEDDMIFVVHPEHRFAGQQVPLKEMVKEPFLFRDEGSFARRQLAALCELHHLEEPAVGLHMTGLHETIRMVIEGNGAAFVSEMEAKEYMEMGKLAIVYVESANLKNTISLCTRKNDPLSPVVQNLVKLM